MDSYVTWVKWKLVSVHLETVLTQRKMGAWFVSNMQWAWKSFWAHPMEQLCDVGQVDARFGPFGGSVNVGENR